MNDTRVQSARLKEMKNLFNVQGSAAKKPYIRPVSVIAPAYIPTVDPTRTICQKLPSEFSHFSRQVSDQECAKSIRRMRPRIMKIHAPMSVM
jgi:hypothetical protein